MNKSIVGWVVAGLAVLCLASRAMADAEADYKALFGEEDQRVVTSKDTKAAADFAFKLLKTAKVNNDKKDLQILLCEKAYDFGMKDPSGYQTAIDAMKLHIKAAPEDGPKAQQKLQEAILIRYAKNTDGAGPTTPAAQPGKELTLDLAKGVTMKLILIPTGSFLMGSPAGEKGCRSEEGPQHEVAISKAFYMGVYEVTQEQYEAVTGTNPSAFKGARNPVEMVSWEDAVEFCKKLSAKTGKTVRLPTEAEWEYACRAGTKTRFSFGDDNADLHKYGNYCDKSNTSGSSWQEKDHDDGQDKTAPVGSYKANAWGLYDMHGNVQEWCSDWYADSYANAGARDPQGPASGKFHVLRGGCWFAPRSACRSASRACMGAPGIDDKSKVTAHKLQSTIVNMNFGGQELGFVIDYLRETTELPIHVKWGALEAAGITSRSAATIGLKKVSADKALEILLGNMSTGDKKLAYTIDEGLIMISTEADLKGRIVARKIDPLFSLNGFRVVAVIR